MAPSAQAAMRQAFLESSQPDGELLGLDVDDQALEIAQNQIIRIWRKRAIVTKSSYANIA